MAIPFKIQYYCKHINKLVTWEYAFDWDILHIGKSIHYYTCMSEQNQCRDKTCYHTTKGIETKTIDAMVRQ